MKQTPDAFSKYCVEITARFQVSFGGDTEWKRNVERQYSDELDELHDFEYRRNCDTTVEYFMQTVELVPTIVRTPVDSSGHTEAMRKEIEKTIRYEKYLEMKKEFE
ncbi:hypothetical protein NVP1081O_172 [Vibrio phage 1.081.O._10N.286.52.C2]|nr:hypothetical protein NVP1081O_172 [Vibrio phage 1.081.O._10N.286.52.C2]